MLLKLPGLENVRGLYQMRTLTPKRLELYYHHVIETINGHYNGHCFNVLVKLHMIRLFYSRMQHLQSLLSYEDNIEIITRIGKRLHMSIFSRFSLYGFLVDSARNLLGPFAASKSIMQHSLSRCSS